MKNLLGMICLMFLGTAVVWSFLWSMKKLLDMHADFFEYKARFKFDNAFGLSVILVSLEFAVAFYVASLFIKVSI